MHPCVFRDAEKERCGEWRRWFTLCVHFYLFVLLFAFSTRVFPELEWLTRSPRGYPRAKPQLTVRVPVLSCSALWGHLQIMWFWTRRGTDWEYDPITYTLRGRDETGEFLLLVQWGHSRELGCAGWVSGEENKVTEGIIFSVIPFILMCITACLVCVN